MGIPKTGKGVGGGEPSKTGNDSPVLPRPKDRVPAPYTPSYLPEVPGLKGNLKPPLVQPKAPLFASPRLTLPETADEIRMTGIAGVLEKKLSEIREGFQKLEIGTVLVDQTLADLESVRNNGDAADLQLIWDHTHILIRAFNLALQRAEIFSAIVQFQKLPKPLPGPVQIVYGHGEAIHLDYLDQERLKKNPMAVAYLHIPDAPGYQRERMDQALEAFNSLSLEALFTGEAASLSQDNAGLRLTQYQGDPFENLSEWVITTETLVRLANFSKFFNQDVAQAAAQIMAERLPQGEKNEEEATTRRLEGECLENVKTLVRKKSDLARVAASDLSSQTADGIEKMSLGFGPWTDYPERARDVGAIRPVEMADQNDLLRDLVKKGDALVKEAGALDSSLGPAASPAEMEQRLVQLDLVADRALDLERARLIYWYREELAYVRQGNEETPLLREVVEGIATLEKGLPPEKIQEVAGNTRALLDRLAFKQQLEMRISEYEARIPEFRKAGRSVWLLEDHIRRYQAMRELVLKGEIQKAKEQFSELYFSETTAQLDKEFGLAKKDVFVKSLMIMTAAGMIMAPVALGMAAAGAGPVAATLAEAAAFTAADMALQQHFMGEKFVIPGMDAGDWGLLGLEFTKGVASSYGLFRVLKASGLFLNKVVMQEVADRALARMAVEGMPVRSFTEMTAAQSAKFQAYLELGIMGRAAKWAFLFGGEYAAMTGWEAVSTPVAEGRADAIIPALASVLSPEAMAHRALFLIGLKLTGFMTHPFQEGLREFAEPHIKRKQESRMKDLHAKGLLAAEDFNQAIAKNDREGMEKAARALEKIFKRMKGMYDAGEIVPSSETTRLFAETDLILNILKNEHQFLVNLDREIGAKNTNGIKAEDPELGIYSYEGDGVQLARTLAKNLGKTRVKIGHDGITIFAGDREITLVPMGEAEKADDGVKLRALARFQKFLMEKRVGSPDQQALFLQLGSHDRIRLRQALDKPKVNFVNINAILDPYHLMLSDPINGVYQVIPSPDVKAGVEADAGSPPTDMRKLLRMGGLLLDARAGWRDAVDPREVEHPLITEGKVVPEDFPPEVQATITLLTEKGFYPPEFCMAIADILSGEDRKTLDILLKADRLDLVAFNNLVHLFIAVKKGDGYELTGFIPKHAGMEADAQGPGELPPAYLAELETAQTHSPEAPGLSDGEAGPPQFPKMKLAGKVEPPGSSGNHFLGFEGEVPSPVDYLVFQILPGSPLRVFLQSGFEQVSAEFKQGDSLQEIFSKPEALAVFLDERLCQILVWVAVDPEHIFNTFPEYREVATEMVRLVDFVERSGINVVPEVNRKKYRRMQEYLNPSLSPLVRTMAVLLDPWVAAFPHADTIPSEGPSLTQGTIDIEKKMVVTAFREAAYDEGKDSQSIDTAFVDRVIGAICKTLYPSEVLPSLALLHSIHVQLAGDSPEKGEARKLILSLRTAKSGMSFDEGLAAILKRTADLHPLRSTELLPPEDRDPFVPGHLRSPVPLSEEAAANPLARHYFFTGPKIEIPAVRQAFDATVRVGNGSGFLVSNQGHILTNAHVMDDVSVKDKYVEIDGRRILIKKENIIYKRVKRGEEADVALLLIPELAGRTHLELSKSIPENGETVFAIGHPNGFTADGKPEKLVSVGLVSGTREGKLLSTAEVRNGNSGGPLLNDKGEVVGIVSGGSQGGYTLQADAVPVEDFRLLVPAESNVSPSWGKDDLRFDNHLERHLAKHPAAGTKIHVDSLAELEEQIVGEIDSKTGEVKPLTLPKDPEDPRWSRQPSGDIVVLVKVKLQSPIAQAGVVDTKDIPETERDKIYIGKRELRGGSYYVPMYKGKPVLLDEATLVIALQDGDARPETIDGKTVWKSNGEVVEGEPVFKDGQPVGIWFAKPRVITILAGPTDAQHPSDFWLSKALLPKLKDAIPEQLYQQLEKTAHSVMAVREAGKIAEVWAQVLQKELNQGNLTKKELVESAIKELEGMALKARENWNGRLVFVGNGDPYPSDSELPAEVGDARKALDALRAVQAKMKQRPTADQKRADKEIVAKEKLRELGVFSPVFEQEIESFRAVDPHRIYEGLLSAAGHKGPDAAIRAYNTLRGLLYEISRRKQVSEALQVASATTKSGAGVVVTYSGLTSDGDGKLKVKERSAVVELDVPDLPGHIYELKSYPRLDYGTDSDGTSLDTGRLEQAMKYDAALRQEGSPYQGATIEVSGNVSTRFLGELSNRAPNVEILYCLKLPSGAELVFRIKEAQGGQLTLRRVPDIRTLSPNEQLILDGIRKTLQTGQVLAEGVLQRDFLKLEDVAHDHPCREDFAKATGSDGSIDPLKITNLEVYKQWEVLLYQKRLRYFEDKSASVPLQRSYDHLRNPVTDEAIDSYIAAAESYIEGLNEGTRKNYTIPEAAKPVARAEFARRLKAISTSEQERLVSSEEEQRSAQRRELGYRGPSEGYPLDVRWIYVDILKGMTLLEAQKTKGKEPPMPVGLKKAMPPLSYEKDNFFTGEETLSYLASADNKLAAEKHYVRVVSPESGDQDIGEQVTNARTYDITDPTDRENLNADIWRRNMERLKNLQRKLESLSDPSKVEKIPVTELTRLRKIKGALQANAEVVALERGIRDYRNRRVEEFRLIDEDGSIPKKDKGAKKKELSKSYDERLQALEQRLLAAYQTALGQDFSHSLFEYAENPWSSNEVKFVYTIDSNGTMRLVNEDQKPFTRRPTHSQLAGGQSIYGGGQIWINGKAVENAQGELVITVNTIDDGSGHYLPDNAETLEYVKNVLARTTAQVGGKTVRFDVGHTKFKHAPLPFLPLSDSFDLPVQPWPASEQVAASIKP